LAGAPPETPQTPLAFSSRDRAEGQPREDGAPAGDESTQDETSVPPVGDLETPFFDIRGRTDELELDLDTRDPRSALKMSVAAARRRAQFARYVSLAMGFAAALCIVALLKTAVARKSDEPGIPRLASTNAPPATPVAPAAANALPRVASAELVAPPEAPPPIDTAATVEPAATSDVAPAVDPEVAGREKGVSRAALERGRLGEAIGAGERSVSLDPSDGEAWLILGAAYQQQGNASEARRCYKACIETGRRGPKNECAAMLR
jgi:tetratricopeptide (TPR) repeat protein